MYKKLFFMSHKELELLVVELKNSKDVITEIYDRYVLYEAFKRYLNSESPLTINWIVQTLGLSFPRVQIIVKKLIENEYLIREQSKDDQRVFNLIVTKQLIERVSLFEKMKTQELYKNNFKPTNQKVPRLSEFSKRSVSKIKEDHLS